jgi:hypothetical protein
MLDKPLYNEPEPMTPLKCELCGLVWGDDKNIDNVDETGMCLHCEYIETK